MIVKLRFDWYEGDYGECWINYNNEKGLDNDLRRAIKLANKSKDYSVRCLPEFYEKVIKIMESKGYKIGYLNEGTTYHFEDDVNDTFKIEKRTLTYKDEVL